MGFELLKKTRTNNEKKKKSFSFLNDCHVNETDTQSKSIKENEKIQSLLWEGWQID